MGWCVIDKTKSSTRFGRVVFMRQEYKRATEIVWYVWIRSKGFRFSMLYCLVLKLALFYTLKQDKSLVSLYFVCSAYSFNTNSMELPWKCDVILLYGSVNIPGSWIFPWQRKGQNWTHSSILIKLSRYNFNWRQSCQQLQIWGTCCLHLATVV